MMPKLDTANPEVRDYFCAVGRYWVENFHIDGWRLDVASEIDDTFWRQFRREVKSVDPDALLIGEVWESAGHWLQGDMFDSAMNYDFRKHCRRFFAEQSMDAERFAGRLTDMLMRYKYQMTPAQLNLLDSHDVSRFLSLCGGDTRPYRLAILFLMSFVGMPTVFYGDELGLQGVLEADYRAPMPWDGGDRELLYFFKLAIAMRHDLEPLRRGDFRILAAKGGLLCFARAAGSRKVTVCLNCGEQSTEVPVPSGQVYWSEGLDGHTLAGFGFGVWLDKLQ